MLAIPSRLPWLGPALLALAAGAGAVLSFAPFGVFPLAVLALALGYQALRLTPGRGFLTGWALGLGLLGLGVWWIRISLNEFGNLPPALAQLLTIVFIAAMALYYGLAGWVVRRWSGAGAAGPLLVLPGAWVLFEWLRGWLFTGFPWLAIGYTQIDSPLGGLAPLLGVYGVSLAVALSGGLVWLALARHGRTRYLALAGFLVLWGAGAGLRLVEWTVPEGPPLKAALVQANIQPSMKWDPESLVPILQAHLELTREHLDADVIVWPETAVPAFLDEVREGLIDPMTQTAREEGGAMVLGIPFRELGGRYFNGLLSLGGEEGLYAKRHLVPFGEFMPFKAWLGPLVKLFEVPMSDFSAGGAGESLLQVGGLPVGASICYEDVFASEVIRALPQAAYLINVSNDAWFGDSLAPWQHLEIARMRALETGRPLVRSTNTGISAVIDHRGLVLGSIPLFQRAGLAVELQPRSGATPFVLWGNWLAIGLALGMLVLGAVLGRRSLAAPGH
jgi:apolipoprotein N-acyltransferase